MKGMYNSLFCFMLFVMVTGISCRKESGHVPPPEEKKYQLITTGTLYNSVTLKYEPFYWIDEQRFPMELHGSVQGFPYGIEKVVSDVYVAGGYQGFHPESGELIMMPCYWKNGEKIDLPVRGLSFSQRCGTADLKWFNDALYIIGDADFIPVIWKVTEGKDPEIVGIPIDKEILAVKKGSNLEKYNNKLYFAGAMKREEEGRQVFSAGYWEIGADDKAAFHVVEDNLGYALCFSISVSSKGIFMAGEYDAVGNNPKPVIWSQQGHLPISNRLNASSQRLSESVIDDSGNLYVNVLDIQQYQPLLWKLPANTSSHEPIKPEVPAAAKGFCHNLSSIDNKIAYTYLYELPGGKKYAATVFNSKTTELDLNKSEFPYIHRTGIFRL